MKIDGKNPLFSHNPLGFFDSSIGRLAIFAITYGDQSRLLETLGGSFKDADPTTFIRTLAPYISYPEQELGDDQTKPVEPCLTQEQVNALSDADLYGIAGVYVDNQEHLYRKQITKHAKNAEGQSIVSFEYGDVEHPKANDESYVDYLHRLSVLEEDRMREQMKSLTRSILGPAHFSQALSQNIAKTLSMGENLSRLTKGFKLPDMGESARKAFKHSSFGVAKPLEPSLLQIDYEAIERNRRAPFEELRVRFDQLIELTGDGIAFATESNKTQTRIAAEIKTSGEESSKIGRDSLKVTRWGFYATIAVFLLTVVGLAISEMDRRRGNRDAEFYRQQAQQLTTGFNEMAAALVEKRMTADQEVKDILGQMEQTRIIQDRQIWKILDGQAKLIHDQGQARAEDRRMIELLQQKLAELEGQMSGVGNEAKPSSDNK